MSDTSAPTTLIAKAPKGSMATKTAKPKAGGAITLTEREIDILVNVWACLKTPPEVDYEKLAGALGMVNHRSAANAWSGVKKKLNMSNPAAGSKAGGKGGKAAASKRKKAALKAAPEDDEEDDDTDDYSITASAKKAKVGTARKGAAGGKKAAANTKKKMVRTPEEDDESDSENYGDDEGVGRYRGPIAVKKEATIKPNFEREPSEGI